MADHSSTDDINILMQILDELKTISKRLLNIEGSLKTLNEYSIENNYLNTDNQLNTTKSDKLSMPSSLEILDLQESRPGIFKTYKAMQRKDDWVTSTEIAEITNRSRGLESRYLNFLSDNGFLLKKRVKVPGEDKATTVHYKITGADE